MKKFLTWLIVILIIGAIIAVTQIPYTSGDEGDNEEVVSDDDIAKFAGSYQDEYSQRASADVELNDDRESLTMRVHWSDSAWSGVIWTMTLNKEENKFVYSDGLKEYYQFIDGEEQETYETMEENQSGYFEIKDNKLYWVGSPEDDCKECVFAKPVFDVVE